MNVSSVSMGMEETQTSFAKTLTLKAEEAFCDWGGSRSKSCV